MLYKQTVAHIEATTWMAARVKIRDWHKLILDEDGRSTRRALTSDVRKAHGRAPPFWIADEVAQWRSRELWDNRATGMGKRTSTLGVTISTQAADALHLFSEMLDAEPVPTIYTQLNAAPIDCALDDQETWKAANRLLAFSLMQGSPPTRRLGRCPPHHSSRRSGCST